MAKLRAIELDKGTCSTHFNTPGWICSEHKCWWSPDWTKYGTKRKQRQQQKMSDQNKKDFTKKTNNHIASIKNSNINNKGPNINNNNINNINKIKRNIMSNKPSDKQLLATAKAQFSAPPFNTDHPIAGLSVAKLISFRKGETINPYRAEPLPVINTTDSSPKPSNATPSTDNQQIQQQQQELQVQQLRQQQQLNPDSRFELDPMRPPIVRLTQQSTEGDGRFLKARLRDPNIMRVVRLYLAYMKDQSASVCIDGMTPTSIRMLLASEGLPTAPDHLHRIFTEVHQEYGVSPAEAVADLKSFRQYLSSERTRHLQQIRESTTKFYSPSPGPSNFRK